MRYEALCVHCTLVVTTSCNQLCSLWFPGCNQGWETLYAGSQEINLISYENYDDELRNAANGIFKEWGGMIGGRVSLCVQTT